MKSAPGPGTTDLGYSTTPHPTKGVCPLGFLDETGWVPKALMPDQVHPSSAGHDIWMEALAPVLAN